MAELNTEVNQRKPFSGMRVLIAVAIGAGLGLAVAYFLKVLIDNSPAEIVLGRLRLFYLMVISSGGLGGLRLRRCVSCGRRPPILPIGIANPSVVVVPKESIGCSLGRGSCKGDST